MVMPNLIFELAVQKKLPNGTVPIIARLIFRRKKVERTIIRVTSEQVALWDPLKKRFKPVATPYLNRIISDYQQKFDKFLSDHYDEIGKLELSDIIKIFDVDKTPEPDALLMLNYLDDYYQNVLLKQFEAGSGTPRNFTTSYNKFAFGKALLFVRDTSTLRTGVTYFFSEPDSIIRLVEYSWNSGRRDKNEIQRLFDFNDSAISKQLSNKGIKTLNKQDTWSQVTKIWTTDAVYIKQFMLIEGDPSRTRVLVSWN